MKSKQSKPKSNKYEEIIERLSSSEELLEIQEFLTTYEEYEISLGISNPVHFAE